MANIVKGLFLDPHNRHIMKIVQILLSQLLCSRLYTVYCPATRTKFFKQFATLQEAIDPLREINNYGIDLYEKTLLFYKQFRVHSSTK